MTDPLCPPEVTSSTPGNLSRNSTYSTPRWVKLMGAIGLILLVVFALRHLNGDGHVGHTFPPAASGHIWRGRTHQ